MAFGKRTVTDSVGQASVASPQEVLTPQTLPSEPAPHPPAQHIISSMHQSTVTSVHVAANIWGIPVVPLVDTGSTFSIINASVWEKLKVSAPNGFVLRSAPDAGLVAANKSRLHVLGMVELPLSFGSSELSQEFFVVEGLSVDVLLGANFLEVAGACIDFPAKRIRLGGQFIPLEIGRTEVSPVASVRICNIESLVIPAGHSMVVPLAFVDDDSQASFTGVDCIVDPLDTLVSKHPLMEFGSSIVSVDNICMLVLNRGSTDIVLQEGTHVAALSVCPDIPQSLNEDVIHTVSASASDEDLITEYVANECGHLPPETREELRQLLLEFSDCFVLRDGERGYCDFAPHKIDTGDHVPTKQHPYRVPYKHREELDSIISDLLEKGTITPSSSPWASPIVLVPKKDGSIRMCVDFRKLNKVTVADAFPLPRIDETLDAFAGCKVFSTLDLAAGYWQIAMDPSDQCKTAFCTPMGLYEFTVLPMGCCNGPATFQRLMQEVLKEEYASKQYTCRAFFDDIGLGAIGISEGMMGLRNVFGRLKQFNLKLRLSKCSFLKTRTRFLGVDICEDGVHTSPNKIDAIRDWPQPTCLKEVRSFLGLCGYYRNSAS